LPVSRVFATTIVAAFVSAAHQAQAQTPLCKALDGEAKSVSRYLISTEHPYDCCDDTIEQCLKTRPDCKLPARLANYVCRKAAGGEGKAAIRRSLQKRALSMMRPGRTYRIETKANPAAGISGAKVRMVVYACTRCPFCSIMVPELNREVTSGRLAGKALLNIKLFPIKTHDHSAEANMAAAAAGTLGRYWEFMLVLMRHFDDFMVEKLPDWAVEAGLERTAFQRAMKSPEVRKALVASKKEGLKNGVTATPTLFINGRKYVGDLDTDTLVDVIEEEAEALE